MDDGRPSLGHSHPLAPQPCGLLATYISLCRFSEAPFWLDLAEGCLILLNLLRLQDTALQDGEELG